MNTLVCLAAAVAAAQPQTFIPNATPAEAMRQELSEPFCYFRAPTDQIGFPGSPNATVVTYDGAFLTPYGELSFYAGEPGKARPITQRVKTMLDGYLPVIQFGFDRDGLRYDFEAFATPIKLDPKNNLVTFIQCRVSNRGKEPRKAILGASFSDIASPVNRDKNYAWWDGQRQALKSVLGIQRGITWHSRQFMNEKELALTKGYSSFGDAPGTREFGSSADVEGSQAVGEVNHHYVFFGPSEGAGLGMPDLQKPIRGACVDYMLNLEPGEARTMSFKLPDVPIEMGHVSQFRDVITAGYNDYRAKTIAYWKNALKPTQHFQVDDPKVMNTLRTSLVNDLTATEIGEDGAIYQRVNKIHYNYMWIRDSSFFVRTYDMLGMHDLARRLLNDFIVWKDGKAVSFFKPGAPEPPGARMSVQDDYWGQVLWAVGQHCRMTNDREFLTQVYPLLAGHIADFVAKVAADPKHLWPVAGPYDNEAINGHYTGHSFWALLGLRNAVWMAKAMGREDDAAKWQAIHDSYRANFMRLLTALTAQSGGYIPPGMDKVADGNDWGNASGGLYPFEVLSPENPMARTTLQIARDFNYQEGIMTYGGNAWVAKRDRDQGKTGPHGYLHHYETFYVTESNTILGEQKKVVQDLYSILAHTGSTNSGFEFSIPPWDTRDPQDNFTPHGWFAARYMSQIRDMLVREQGNELHLASALAPEWVAPGKDVIVRGAPTYFGTVSYRMRCRADGASIRLDSRWTARPTKTVLHTPWFVRVDSAKVDGRVVPTGKDGIELPVDARSVELKWHWIEHPNLSYKEAVRLYLRKYYFPKPGEDKDFLFPEN